MNKKLLLLFLAAATGGNQFVGAEEHTASTSWWASEAEAMHYTGKDPLSDATVAPTQAEKWFGYFKMGVGCGAVLLGCYVAKTRMPEWRAYVRAQAARKKAEQEAQREQAEFERNHYLQPGNILLKRWPNESDESFADRKRSKDDLYQRLCDAWRARKEQQRADEDYKDFERRRNQAKEQWERAFRAWQDLCDDNNSVREEAQRGGGFSWGGSASQQPTVGNATDADYRLLGIERCPIPGIVGNQAEADAKKAYEVAAKKAYRTKSLATHPDKNRNNPNAENQFKALGAAWERIKKDKGW